MSRQGNIERRIGLIGRKSSVQRDDRRRTDVHTVVVAAGPSLSAEFAAAGAIRLSAFRRSVECAAAELCEINLSDVYASAD
jgi:hypothetical protein